MLVYNCFSDYSRGVSDLSPCNCDGQLGSPSLPTVISSFFSFASASLLLYFQFLILVFVILVNAQLSYFVLSPCSRHSSKIYFKTKPVQAYLAKCLLAYTLLTDSTRTVQLPENHWVSILYCCCTVKYSFQLKNAIQVHTSDSLIHAVYGTDTGHVYMTCKQDACTNLLQNFEERTYCSLFDIMLFLLCSL